MSDLIREKIGDKFYKLLGDEFDKQYMIELRKKLNYEYANYNIRPAKSDVFKALKTIDKIKVVIIGQDPYPNYHANGLI